MPWLPPSTTMQGESQPCGAPAASCTRQHSGLRWNQEGMREEKGCVVLQPRGGCWDAQRCLSESSLPTVQHSPSYEQGMSSLCILLLPLPFSALGSESGKALTQRTHPRHSQSCGVGDQNCPDSVPSFRNWFIPPIPSKTTPSSCS